MLIAARAWLTRILAPLRRPEAPIAARERSLPPTCPYCHCLASFYPDGGLVLPVRDIGPVWLCRDCAAWIGCKPNTNVPLGRLADGILRRAKIEARKAFDPIWQTGRLSRREADKWLARQLRIKVSQCDFNLFNLGQCVRVIERCRGEHNGGDD